MRNKFSKAQRKHFLTDASTGAYIQCSREGCSTPAQHIHHKVAVCDGGTDEPINLEMLCQEHHVSLHKANGDFAKWGELAGKKTASTGKGFSNLKQFKNHPERLEVFYSVKFNN